MFDLLQTLQLPFIYLTAVVACQLMPKHVWCVAKSASLVGMFSSIGFFGFQLASLWLHSQAITGPGQLMTVLIAVLAWVIIQFSFRYLSGESNQKKYLRYVFLALASAALLVSSNNLLVIALAWAGTSLFIHPLLIFYAQRQAAQLVAHKRFLVSRLSDCCLVVALVLVYVQVGSFDLNQLKLFIVDNNQTALPWTLHFAAVLFALVAILKSAQLPLHGWLIQVMEAPTPVSALMHAGIVNIGGYVLIQLSSLLAQAFVAQALLVIVGSLTAILAGFVMLTRISIKVRLAWSTCAQMGFMLVEVGLGLYELALLHLVSHSFYKAYAFLSSGMAVTQNQKRVLLLGWSHNLSVAWHLGCLVFSTALVFGLTFIWQNIGVQFNIPLVALCLVSFGLAPVIGYGALNVKTRVWAVIQVLLLINLYLIWHYVFSRYSPPSHSVSPILVGWVICSFLGFYVLQILFRHSSRNRFTQKAYFWAYNGFYLDESFTRFAFKFWPARFHGPHTKDSISTPLSHSGNT